MPEALHRSMQKNGTGRGGGECADCGASEDSPPPQCATCTATKSDYTRKDEQEMFHPTGARGLECFALPMALTANYSAVRSILRIALRNAISNSICKKKRYRVIQRALPRRRGVMSKSTKRMSLL